MVTLLSVLLIIAAILSLVGLILFNKKRAEEQNLAGITWSNIGRKTEEIADMTKGVEKAHIDEEYATKQFSELAKKDKVISVISVGVFFLIVASIVVLIVGLL